MGLYLNFAIVSSHIQKRADEGDLYLISQHIEVQTRLLQSEASLGHSVSACFLEAFRAFLQAGLVKAG